MGAVFGTNLAYTKCPCGKFARADTAGMRKRHNNKDITGVKTRLRRSQYASDGEHTDEQMQDPTPVDATIPPDAVQVPLDDDTPRSRRLRAMMAAKNQPILKIMRDPRDYLGTYSRCFRRVCNCLEVLEKEIIPWLSEESLQELRTGQITFSCCQLKQFYDLQLVGCTLEETAKLIGIPVLAIHEIVRNSALFTQIANKSAAARTYGLRKAMLEKAILDRNSDMLKFLGRSLLGMRDGSEKRSTTVYDIKVLQTELKKLGWVKPEEMDGIANKMGLPRQVLEISNKSTTDLDSHSSADTDVDTSITMGDSAYTPTKVEEWKVSEIITDFDIPADESEIALPPLESISGTNMVVSTIPEETPSEVTNPTPEVEE